jgi:hypothetical protein
MAKARQKRKNGHQIALRVERSLLAAIDAEVARLRRERPGANTHRSDAVREVLHRVFLSSQSSSTPAPSPPAAADPARLGDP